MLTEGFPPCFIFPLTGADEEFGNGGAWVIRLAQVMLQAWDRVPTSVSLLLPLAAAPHSVRARYGKCIIVWGYISTGKCPNAHSAKVKFRKHMLGETEVLKLQANGNETLVCRRWVRETS